MSRATAILDTTILLMLEQVERGGRWHLSTCEFSVEPFYPTNSLVPVIVTDQAIFDATHATNRPDGYRHMTTEEAARYHKTLPCWLLCEAVNLAIEPTTEQHINRECTVRCAAVRTIIAENAGYIGVREEHIRELAGRRHKRRRYFSDGNDLRDLRSFNARTGDHG